MVSFRTFMENQAHELEANIPLPPEVFALKNVFKRAGHHLFVVGGSVRDYLMHKFDRESGQFSPKDIDLATDAKPQEIHKILDNARISNFGKGEAFGVWVAHLNGQDFEIATLRQDGAGGDGRRPDQVTYTDDPRLDHARRDLTMNALFYDIPESPKLPGKVIDYGTGIEDIKNKKVRVIGDPYARFGEDRLRIPRLARFHSRWNDGDMALDPRTSEAIKHYKDLTKPSRYYTPETGHAHDLTPVSGERIQQEFVAGLGKAKNVVSYLKNYHSLGLLNSVFPDLNVDIAAIDRLENSGIAKNPVYVLALLLRKNTNPKGLRMALNRLKWPSEIIDEVEFLVNAFHNHRTAPGELLNVIKTMGKNPERQRHLSNFGSLVHREVDPQIWGHLGQYQPQVFSGDEIQKQYGIGPGPAMGAKQKELQTGHYVNSFQNFLKRKF